jgi:preprotein translocase subunit YajC
MNPLILVLIIGAVVVFFIYRKSKNNKEGTKIVSVRRSKDEV